MDEFDVINRFFKPLCDSTPEVGIGDDAAIIDVASIKQLVVSVDTLIDGVHFDDSYSANNIAQRALRVNLSDLAAMGAKPRYFTLAISLPNIDELWLHSFSEGLMSCAKQYGVTLIGGDTTQAQTLSITIQMMGERLPQGVLLRKGAKAGDDVYVSGNLGDAALALKQSLKGDLTLFRHLHDFKPRIELGQALLGIATACIDISDGLSGDLGHILKESKVGAVIDYKKLPFSDAMQSYLSESQDYALPLIGGDDYELCFCAPVKNRNKIDEIAHNLATKISRIGLICQDEKFVIENYEGRVGSRGYRHFDDLNQSL